MIGQPRVHFRATDSTNERARVLAAAGAPHGTLVTADEQSAGRGRQGRAWTAPSRSAVLMSVVLREVSETLPLAAAVAVCEALPVEAQIKWPNDVWIEGRKVAGILVEARPQEGWAVLGIGLNVTTEELPAELEATSLLLAGAALSPDQALAALLEALRVWLPRPSSDVLAAWRSRDALLGRAVRWSNGSKEGVAAGVDDSGALIVETVDGRVTLDAGEVHLER
ncbi:MAG: BirA family transcriptional regulator [Thermoleophilaceae bacterium]|nr:BirA family transcriptional regulator [Thermoleophilaceae bacterium]